MLLQPTRSQLFPYTTLFRSLVNPGLPIPPTITVLTGITEAMVLPAPRIGEVLEPFVEFLGPPSPDRVLAGHNVRFDRSEEHTSELQSRPHLVCRLLLEKKKE